MMTVSTSTGAPPRVASPARSNIPGSSGKKEKDEKGDKRKEEKGEKKKEKFSLLSTARAKATGSLRKALYGKSKKKELSRDAEDLEEEDEYSSSVYDTVRSLPASGHYGNRRRAAGLRVQVDYADGPPGEGSGSGSSAGGSAADSRPRSSAGSSPFPASLLPPPHGGVPLTSAVVIRLPRRRVSQPPGVPRLSPLGLAAAARLRSGVPAAPTDPDPAFDFAAWHSSLDLINNQDAVYSLFMKAHKCYDLIPVSTKLVVFDTQLPVRKAFFALVYNGVRAAPLWDNERQQFIGMLTITDFIKILYRHHKAGDDEEKMKALEEEKIAAWRKEFDQDGEIRPLVCIDPNESLFRAVEMLCDAKVHRLPVLERSTGNISYILTHKRIMKFLYLYLHDLPKPTFMDETPKSLGIGSWGDIRTIHVDTPLIDALRIFLENRVSALPLVDENDKVVDIYAKFDVISLAADKVYNRLDISVHEALKHRQEWFEGVRTCKESDSLFAVIDIIVRAEVHRLIVTDENEKVVGIVSLSDILKYLVLDQSGLCDAKNNISPCGSTLTSGMMELDAPVFDIPEEDRAGSEDI